MPQTPRAWMMRLQPGAGPGDQVSQALKAGEIFVGWTQTPTLSDAANTKDDYRRLMRAAYSPDDVSDRQIGKWIGDAWRFLREMRVGDVVIVPHGDDLHLAEVTGPPYHDGSFGHLDAVHRRHVSWLREGGAVPRRSVSDALQTRLKSRYTCLELTQFLPEIKALAHDTL